MTWGKQCYLGPFQSHMHIKMNPSIRVKNKLFFHFLDWHCSIKNKCTNRQLTHNLTPLELAWFILLRHWDIEIEGFQLHQAKLWELLACAYHSVNRSTDYRPIIGSLTSSEKNAVFIFLDRPLALKQNSYCHCFSLECALLKLRSTLDRDIADEWSDSECWTRSDSGRWCNMELPQSHCMKGIWFWQQKD